MMIFALLFGLVAHAGNGNVVGNGGNTIYCPQPISNSPVYVNGRTVLDLAEGQSTRNYHYTRLLQLRGMSLDQAFPKALALFVPNSVFERSQLAMRYQNRKQEIRFVDGELPFISTFSPLQLSGCSIQQAAVQYGQEHPSPDDPLDLALSRRIWNGLSVDLQVALLFHEFLMKDHLLMQGACTVNNIRELTGFVLSDESLKVSPSDWRFEIDRNCQPDPERRGN
ncbi:MAG: hypothetical protein ACXVB9_15530 [Bdellovibrionota bacterium]